MKPQQEVQLSDSAITQILEGLDESKLGDWEKGFIASVRNYWKKNKKISPKQSKRLSEIWRKQHEPS